MMVRRWILIIYKNEFRTLAIDMRVKNSVFVIWRAYKFRTCAHYKPLDGADECLARKRRLGRYRHLSKTYGSDDDPMVIHFWWDI
jgi:hypothetical protein